MSPFSINFYDIAEIKNKKTFLNSGKEGACYFLDDKTLIKLFHVLDAKRKIYFSSYKSDNIAFPIDVYYYDNTSFIEGYTMNYLEGVNIAQGFKSSLLIVDLINAYNKIRMEIEKFSNIYMADLVGVNILYDYQNNKINIIDTSKWYPMKDGMLKNISRLDAILIDRLLTVIKNDYQDLLKKNERLELLFQEYTNILMEFQYLEKVYNPNLFREFVDELVKTISNYQDEVFTIGDLKTKIIKKS